MQALDGNAIAGALYEHFGREMTTVTGTCRHCGARAQIAELVVYARGPGTVVRCPSCANVVLVLVRSSVDAEHFDLSGATIADT